jgi:hypothetical protein
MAWLALPILSLIVLGAHFYRAGSTVLVVIVLAVLALLAVRRRWAMRVVQAALLVGAFEWSMTTFELAFWRAAAGQPMFRLVLILAVVTAFTAASALVFQTERLRAVYRPRSSPRAASDS